jgi:hypothetical protein
MSVDQDKGSAAEAGNESDGGGGVKWSFEPTGERLCHPLPPGHPSLPSGPVCGVDQPVFRVKGAGLTHTSPETCYFLPPCALR